MSEGVFTITVSTAGLAPQQRQELDAQLRSEGIPATWLGESVQVDQAFEARVEGLVATARSTAPAGPAPAPGSPPAPTGFVPTGGTYPAPPYPAPGYPAGYGYPAAPLVTNSNATTALVLAIIGWVVCPIVSIFGVIYARRALDEIADSGGTQGGEGMAKFSLIASWIIIGIWGVTILALIAIFGILAIGAAAS